MAMAVIMCPRKNTTITFARGSVTAMKMATTGAIEMAVIQTVSIRSLAPFWDLSSTCSQITKDCGHGVQSKRPAPLDHEESEELDAKRFL